jgi:membrane protease YdiL (CAAX protease family)
METGSSIVLDRKPLLVFLALAFGISWPLFAVPLAFRGADAGIRQIVATVAWALAMWGPGIGALVATRLTAGRSLRTLHLNRLGTRRAYLWAWLLPPVLGLLAGLSTMAFGIARVDTSFPLIRQSFEAVPGGLPVAPWVAVTIEILFSLTLAPLINTVFAVGEELGWRGFLLPRLEPLGQWKAIVVSGAVWGFWHAPAVLQGLNYPSAPVLGTLMMIVGCVLLGTIFSWLYLRTRSPWTPALAHGAFNATAGISILFLAPFDRTWGGTPLSPPGWLGMVLVVAWLVATRRLPVKREVGAVERLPAPVKQA